MPKIKSKSLNGSSVDITTVSAYTHETYGQACASYNNDEGQDICKAGEFIVVSFSGYP